MKFIITAVVTIFLQTSAFADLSGSWQGWGIWMLDGEGVNCHMNLRFTESEKRLVRHGGYFECNLVGMETYGAEWDLLNNELFFENAVVGTYDGKQFSMVELANDTTNVHTSMTITGDTMSYEEKWVRNDGLVIYEIYGNFKRQ